MPNAYITPYDYLRASTGQETDSLIGNLTRLASGVAVGATALPLATATTVALSINDQLTLFDGTSSEVVTVTAIAPIGASSVQVSATQYAHATGVVVCSDGIAGSLSDRILTASDMVEDITYQQLLLDTHTDTLALRTMSASISNIGALLVRTLNFPVQSVSGAVVTLPGGNTISFATNTQVTLDSKAHLVKIYPLVPLSNASPTGSPFQSSLHQRTEGAISLTYTSGFAFGAMPPRIKNAAILLVSDLLSRRDNRSGAFMTQMGKVKVQYAPPTDTSGQSLLYKSAMDNLSSFIVEPM